MLGLRYLKGLKALGLFMYLCMCCDFGSQNTHTETKTNRELEEASLLKGMSKAMFDRGINGDTHPTILWFHALISYDVIGKAKSYVR